MLPQIQALQRIFGMLFDGGNKQSQPDNNNRQFTQALVRDYTGYRQPLPPQPQPQSNPQLTPQHLDPRVTDLPHVWGNVLFHQIADQQGYAPLFKQVIQNTNPQVLDKQAFQKFSGDPQADASYNPDLNSMAINSSLVGQPGMNYGFTHEGLHGMWNYNQPQQRQQFVDMAQANMNPADRRNLSSAMAGYGYNGGMNDLNKAPNFVQNEVHSYLPLGAESNKPGTPIGNYYRQYFSNSNFK